MDKLDLMKLIGDNVRRFRIERNMTQEQLAAMVDKNSSAITRIEGGQRMMSIMTLLAVSDALGVSCDALLREPSRGTEQENIVRSLSGLPEEELARVERMLRAYLDK